MMTANCLVTDYGFKRKTKNKQKTLVNDEYGLILKIVEGYSNSFIDINTAEEYHTIGDIITKFALVDIDRDSKRYNQGLYEINLRQGDFNSIYKDNKQNGEFFISHDKAKKILEAQFNRLICGPLMLSSGEPNYNYYIKETKYEFRISESNIVTLTLYYNYIDRRGYHDFWKIYDIYDFDKYYFPVNRRVGSKVPLDLIIENFLK